MKTQPKLLRLVTPPPIALGNLLQGQSLHDVTSKALGLHLAKSLPTSVPRNCPFKLHLITIHPCQPLIAYLMVPEGNDKKSFPSSVVVQHAKTRAIVWSLSFGDMASMLFDYDVLDKTAEHRQHKLLKDLGQAQRLDFFDPSTLYWSGHGTISSPNDVGKRWSYLFVQLTNRIVIVNLRKHSVAIATSPDKTTETVYKPLLAHITQDARLGLGHFLQRLARQPTWIDCRNDGRFLEIVRLEVQCRHSIDQNGAVFENGFHCAHLFDQQVRNARRILACQTSDCLFDQKRSGLFDGVASDGKHCP